jgi:signal transduction histidine kinase
MKQKIGTKLISSFMLMELLLAVTAFYAVGLSLSSLTEAVGKSSISITEQILQKIEKDIYLKLEMILTAAEHEVIIDPVIKSNDKFGGPINNDLTNHLKEEFIDFYEKTYGYRVFSEIAVINKYGSIVAQAGAHFDDNQEDNQWRQNTIEQGYFIGDIEFRKNAGTNGLTIGVRIDDHDDNFIGLVNAFVSAENIFREAELTVKKYDTTRIFLTTQDGRLIYSTNAFRLLDDISEKDFFKNIKDENGHFVASQGGSEKLYSYVRSKGHRYFKGHGWILIMAHDVSEVLKPVFDLRRQIITVSLILFVCGIFIAFLISRSISRSIIIVRDAAAIIAEGDFDKKIEQISKDEIGDLAASFNQMTDKLNASYMLLEDKVKTRTLELETANEHLKDEITEREHAVHEKEKLRALVIQSQKLESIGTLAGGVAHEINNPINGILNYAQLIKDKTDTESGEYEYASEIILETERVSTIVRNLLTFARQDSQSHSPARITDIIKGATTLIQTIIRKDMIELHIDVPEDLPKLDCRSQQIQQVIMNLMTNARDALNQRYKEYDENKIIRISACTITRGGRTWVRTTVEDHGTGISSKVMKRMFDPFYTTKDHSKGTGLGLSISHGIVQEHGGELIVESEPGEYTRFHLDLPVVEKKGEEL